MNPKVDVYLSKDQKRQEESADAPEGPASGLLK